jgi:hypothetical protein
MTGGQLLEIGRGLSRPCLSKPCPWRSGAAQAWGAVPALGHRRRVGPGVKGLAGCLSIYAQVGGWHMASHGSSGDGTFEVIQRTTLASTAERNALPEEAEGGPFTSPPVDGQLARLGNHGRQSRTHRVGSPGSPPHRGLFAASSRTEPG